MKKAFNIYKKTLLFILVVCFFLFNISCGLDTFYVIEAPYQLLNNPEYSSSEYSERYFKFVTNETASVDEGFTVTGTEVYYKIYASSSKMINDVNALISISNDDERSSSAPDKLKDTYKYKTLRIENNSNTLVPFTNHNQTVEIRLTDYQNISNYSSRVEIDSVIKGIPVRNLGGKNYTFNFGRNGENDKIPLKDDEDFDETNSSGDGKYYVALFATSFGHDNTFTNYYSNILYLGSITIDSNSFDN